MQDLKVKGLGLGDDIHFTPQKIGNVSGLQDRLQDQSRAGGKGVLSGKDVPIDELVEEKKACGNDNDSGNQRHRVKEEETPANPKLEDEYLR